MQVIGLCRFSYPALGGFQVEHDSIEERIRFLYQEHRLQERFHLFETVALPCLREQTDQEFDLIIVIGDSLPKHHQDRLRDLTADMPQVTIVSEAPGRHRPVMKSILNRARHDLSKPCLQFRHDDDDAISVDFVERLRAAARDCEGLLKQNETVAIDNSLGFIAELGPLGIAARKVFMPLTTAALGMYVAGGCRTSIMNFGHHRINQFMPTVSYSDAPMWVRTHNLYNDSRQKKVKPIEVSRLTPKQLGEFEARFAIRIEHVQEVFAA